MSLWQANQSAYWLFNSMKVQSKLILIYLFACAVTSLLSIMDTDQIMSYRTFIVEFFLASIAIWAISVIVFFACTLLYQMIRSFWNK